MPHTEFLFQKARRATRSSLAGETILFADSFKKSFTFQHNLQRMLECKTAVLMFTDSKLLFDVIPGNRYTTELRPKLSIATV